MASFAWLKKCEDAYQFLEDFNEDPALSTMLLTDIRAIFDHRSNPKISSEELVEELNSLKDQPWCESRNGRPMSQRGLAAMLVAYEIKPAIIRMGTSTPRGYELDQFDDAFKRYLPPRP